MRIWVSDFSHFARSLPKLALKSTKPTVILSVAIVPNGMCNIYRHSAPLSSSPQVLFPVLCFCVFLLQRHLTYLLQIQKHKNKLKQIKPTKYWNNCDSYILYLFYCVRVMILIVLMERRNVGEQNRTN